MKNAGNDNTKLCFSYVRFSSKKQERGSSIERQTPIPSIDILLPMANILA